MRMPRARWGAALVCAIVPAVALAGCSTEYHGYDSSIDGVLWRQVASFEDPLSRSIYAPLVNEPTAYLDSVDSALWDRAAASVADLGVEDGGVVLYDISSTESTAEFSVFISSGPRSDDSADEVLYYNGPSSVFTCYGITARFYPEATPLVDRVIFAECPAALVKAAPLDAAFSSGEVFDG